MTGYLDALSVLILFSAFILVANKRMKSYIKTFRFQSALIAAAAGIIGMRDFLSEGHLDILIVCAVIVALKVVYIPNILNKTYHSVEYEVEKDFFYNIPLLSIICCLLVVFAYYAVSSVEGINSGTINMKIVNSVSLVLIGMFFMVSRKKAIGQMVGFLVMENGLFVTALFSTNGLPFIVDMGIFIDLVTAILIMGVMVFRINDLFESADINKLRNLKG